MNQYGSLELFFEYEPNHAVTVLFTTSVMGIPSFVPLDTDLVTYPISIEINSVYDSVLEKTFIKISSYFGDDVINISDYECNADTIDLFKIRVFFFNKRLSVYLNNKWIYSYSASYIDYPDTIDMSLTVTGEVLDINNINVVELSDGRDAVYVDYEANTDSAIGTIIQERPIEMYPGINRTIQFTYDSTKNELTGVYVRKYEESEQGNSGASSDGLVYALDVSISIDTYTAKELGLITKLYRLSDLDTGIAKAVKALQKRARQSRNKISITTRVDPRVEIGDIYILDGVVLTGTSTPVYDRMIVEDLNLNIVDGNNMMTISGRKDVDYGIY